MCVCLEWCYALQHVCETDDRDEVVVCELCEANVANFNQHMKKSHPGCGRSANRQGYRSNGSYVDGWFGGECGSGNPYYLLCSCCREKYLAIKSKAKVPVVERYWPLEGSSSVLQNVCSLGVIFWRVQVQRPGSRPPGEAGQRLRRWETVWVER